MDVIVPLYNDAHRIDKFMIELENETRNLQKNIAIKFIFINDGSQDNPYDILLKYKGKNAVTLIELSRNFGKESALAAGIDFCSGDAAIFLDVDLQDPAHLVPGLINTWIESSCDTVIAERLGPQTARSLFSRLYLKILGMTTELEVSTTVGETRLINRSVIDALKELRENQRFTRGLFSWVGFEVKTLSFRRGGSPEKSRFTVRKLFKLAADGLFAFSLFPLRLITLIGSLLIILSALGTVALIYLRASGYISLPGYSSTLLVLMFFSSFQILFLGVVGEYVGRILIESKRRPIYVTKSVSVF